MPPLLVGGGADVLGLLLVMMEPCRLTPFAGGDDASAAAVGGERGLKVSPFDEDSWFSLSHTCARLGWALPIRGE